MDMAMYAIIGAKINAPTGYWICFAVYCVFRIVKIIVDVVKEAMKER